jgi:ribosomal protein S18 acetylase RimI-like enzyme
LAEDRNKIVGICECKLKKERESHVGELAVGVRKEYRGIGLGKFLFGKILKLAKRKLRPKIFRLSVFEGNEIAKNLYKKIWFQRSCKNTKTNRV